MNLSFIKLDINIMNDSKIKVIRKMPDGDKLFILWIGILCLGMKSGKVGILEIGDGIPFTDEMLATELDLELQTIRLGLNVFIKLKMIEVFADGSIFISNFEKHQELERIAENNEKTRIRVSNFRERKRIEFDVTRTAALRNVTVPKCNATDIDKDKDKDKDKEIDITESWNKFALTHNLSQIIKLTSKREVAIRQRLKEDEFNFELILQKISESDFLLGKVGDWKVDFDFILKEGNYLKILEGKYNNENKIERKTNYEKSSKHYSGFDAEQMQRLLGHMSD